MELKDLLGIVVAFVIGIIALAIGASMVREVQTGQSETITGGYFNNISVAITTTGYNITAGNAHTALHEKCSFTLASCVVYNSSDKDVIPTTNYTITNPSDCILNLQLDDALHNESAKLVDCPYSALGGTLYNVSRSGQMALSDFSSWFPTLALVIVAGMVVGVLVFFFVRRMA